MNSYRNRRRGIRQSQWLPSSTYYFLSSALAIAVFFAVWAILNDAGEESPWIPAGLAASGLLIAAGVMKEVLLRRIQTQRIIEQMRLDRTLRFAPVVRNPSSPDKLTLEQNAAILGEIQQKSDAAKVLSSIPASHREVFELCEHYLALVDAELPYVSIGSPRLRPLTNGRDYAARFHKYHMLKWAEMETRSLAQSAAAETDMSRKMERASQVLSALEKAISHYPDEIRLRESGDAVMDLSVSLRARALIDRAREAKFLGDDEEFESLTAGAVALIVEREMVSGTSSPIFEAMRDEIRSLADDTLP